MLDSNSWLTCRSRLVTLAGAVALVVGGCNVVLEPIEQNYLFRPRSSYSDHLNSVASRERGIEEVRLKTPDGVTLHGWLKHPAAVRPGRRFPLVIVFGGVRRENFLADRSRRQARTLGMAIH